MLQNININMNENINIKYQNQQNVEKLNQPITIERVPKEQLSLDRNFVDEV